jgi:hypothetical protein
MFEGMAKQKATRASRGRGARKLAAKTRKTANAGMKAKRPAKPGATAKPGAAKPAKLLAGGNPQSAKADGDAPVQAYLAALPGWKQGVGRRLDALIVRAVPGLRKAVKWNSPFYAVEGQGWFLSFHCLTKYIKVTFFRGTSLRPVPPGKSKRKLVRYLDVHEDDQLDEAQFAAWVKHASGLPGERLWALGAGLLTPPLRPWSKS